jgi:ionotropic kainate glutamate receptor 2
MSYSFIYEVIFSRTLLTLQSVRLVFIGAIMTEEQRGGPTEQLFKYAVERINRDPELLPNTTLIYDIHYVDREDSWHASKKGTAFMLPCQVKQV